MNNKNQIFGGIIMAFAFLILSCDFSDLWFAVAFFAAGLLIMFQKEKGCDIE